MSVSGAMRRVRWTLFRAVLVRIGPSVQGYFIETALYDVAHARCMAISGVAVADENFNITIDHDRRFLKIALYGIWTRETVDQYRDAVRKTVKAMPLNGYSLQDVGVLIDTRMLAVQSRDVAEYYSQTPIYSTAHPRKIATLVVSRLVGIQVRRIGTGTQEIFEDENEAMGWLFGNVK